MAGHVPIHQTHVGGDACHAPAISYCNRMSWWWEKRSCCGRSLLVPMKFEIVMMIVIRNGGSRANPSNTCRRRCLPCTRHFLLQSEDLEVGEKELLRALPSGTYEIRDRHDDCNKKWRVTCQSIKHM